jgi:FkbM family methyltransferase
MGDSADSRSAQARARSREARDEFLDLASRFTPFVAADCGDATFIVSTSGEKVGRSLFCARGRGEMTTLGRSVRVIQRLLGKGAAAGTFLDVGANIGTSTITALRSHPFSSAVACEPHPDNVRLLRLNAIVNDLDDVVEAVPVAVSNAPGTARLAVSRVNSGSHRVVTADVPGTTIEVEQVTLDGLAERNVITPAEVGLVWIDVQGHEGHVLAGAKSLVTRGTPIVMELHVGMLEESGGLAWAMKAIREHYTHFVDLRDASKRRGTIPLRPTADVTEFAQAFRDERREGRFTDVLLVRQPPRGWAEEPIVPDAGRTGGRPPRRSRLRFGWPRPRRGGTS